MAPGALGGLGEPGDQWECYRISMGFHGISWGLINGNSVTNGDFMGFEQEKW